VIHNAVFLSNKGYVQLMEKKQNRSHAVMAQRSEAANSLDNFPTPPWATRALLEMVIHNELIGKRSCLEPACGAGHMSKVLVDHFDSVTSSDIYNYGFGKVVDFCSGYYDAESFDWVITNPPFKLAEQFVFEGLRVAKVGVALLTRTVFIESAGRYERLFKDTPPSTMAQFAERVPMVKGRLDKNATTATGYAWLIWLKENRENKAPELEWIKPCRRALEKTKDYLEPLSSSPAA
jgi:hypothetical protein